MKRRILNLIYNFLVEIGILLLLFIPFFGNENIFDVMQNVKLHYVSFLGAIYFIVLLWSFANAVLAWLARDTKKEDSYTQKKLGVIRCRVDLPFGFPHGYERKSVFGDSVAREPLRCFGVSVDCRKRRISPLKNLSDFTERFIPFHVHSRGLLRCRSQ